MTIGVRNLNELDRKIVIERDYTAELERLDVEITPEDKVLMGKALEYLEHIKTVPFVVNRRAAAEFDQMVADCDKIAKEFSGRLKAVVDYECHEASITLECVYVDFNVGEFMDILQSMAAKALQVRFEPLTSGLLRITIFMPYFSRKDHKE